MRSTSKARLLQCKSARGCPPDAFLAWRLSKRFVVGGQLSSRAELRAGARALRRLLAPGDNRFQEGA